MTSTMPSPAPTTAFTAAPALPAILGTYKRQAPLFVRGDGVYMFDEHGKKYLDLVAGIAVTSLGHNDPGVMHAMQEALATGLIHTSNLYRRWGGTQGFPNKHHIIAVRGAFHGRMPGTLAATDRSAYRLPFRPLMGGVTIVERDLDELARALHPEKTAAVIVEPIQGEGGVRVVDPEFLRGLRELTREKNVLLILDEIQCGLGRTGTFFAHEQIGVVPDMLTIAKPLANGLPIGAILVNDAVARAMQPGDHGTTFGGGPLLAHVAHHVVQRLSDPAMLQHVRETGAWFGEQLQGIADRTGQVRAIRGKGLMWGMDVHEPAAAIIGRAFEKGLLLVSAGEHTLRFLPPLVITKNELAEGLAILEAAMQA